jgi:hypothetical protein
MMGTLDTLPKSVDADTSKNRASPWFTCNQFACNHPISMRRLKLWPVVDFDREISMVPAPSQGWPESRKVDSPLSIGVDGGENPSGRT